jgi:hypothetical protein
MGMFPGHDSPNVRLLKNPPGGGSFALSLRWLSTQSPLRGFSCFAALAAAKIPRRRTLRIFKARSGDFKLVAGERGGEAIGEPDEEMLFGPGRSAGDDADGAARVDEGIVWAADFNEGDDLGAGGDVVG